MLGRAKGGVILRAIKKKARSNSRRKKSRSDLRGEKKQGMKTGVVIRGPKARGENLVWRWPGSRDQIGLKGGGRQDLGI